MESINWKRQFTQHQGLSQMGVVMLYHLVSINDLYPYFKDEFTKELCNKELYQCQKKIPILSLEEFTHINKGDGLITITVNFNSKNTKFSYEDMIILDNLESIIDEMFAEESQTIYLKNTFEKRDDDGVTNTEWNIVNKFL